MIPTTQNSTGLKSRLSFRPFLMTLRKMIAENKPGARSLYGDLVESLEDNPELLKPIENEEFLQTHQKIIDTLCATIFPPATNKNETPYAVTYPFAFKTIYASGPFNELFIDGAMHEIEIPYDDGNGKIWEASIALAYNLVLREYYSMTPPEYETFIFSYPDSDRGIKKMEMKIDARFMDVKKRDEKFVLPEKTESFHSLNTDELKKLLPINNFIFEGVTIMDVIDVTEREIVSEIKTDLITLNSFSDAAVYDNLQVHIQTLIGLKDLQVGVTPFFRVNNFYLLSGVHTAHSLLFNNEKMLSQKEEVIQNCIDWFGLSDKPFIYEELDETDVEEKPSLGYYYEQGYRSLILWPLRSESGFLGLLEIASHKEGTLKAGALIMIEQIIPLFTLALEKGQEQLESEIDRKIKENFTAIQSAVEWKFTEVAFNFIQEKLTNDNAKLPVILFENVYPLFGAVDIRNSTAERGRALKEDLVDQLKYAKEVADKVKDANEFPILREMLFKIDSYLNLDPEKWVAEDDMTIHSFLQEDVHSLFSNLKHNMPELSEPINSYFQVIDPDRKMVYQASKRYEDSITEINDALSTFVDQEQFSAQKIFPHYFERYVTDGIEFNIYIGQSIAPTMKFDEIYVRNLKMWQLELLAKAGRLTHRLEQQLPLHMQTTQLILVHSVPISISFRNQERKFDVDGAYNTRYEVIKKRIDKVNIKGTDQRLTQPGKIAIVYSQAKDANDYREFIQFLQNQKLAKEGLEDLDLEELQGVSGLKALRFDINFD